ncbi:hypothetical protein C7M84_002307 [Penaeus vannamei]|uniref:Uncharacterized protein n=1 Tax=Penaeus vannamei TaxID=6689 RepID=A0A3R7MKA6_PENVA|nr:hypothetical protein C7M84_002307 [Penaeus vannamei]
MSSLVRNYGSDKSPFDNLGLITQRAVECLSPPQIAARLSPLVLRAGLALFVDQGVRVWHVAADLVTVPLDASGSSSLSVFSNQEVSPTFTLGKERIPLSWVRPGLVAGNHSGRALPHFVQHN